MIATLRPLWTNTAADLMSRNVVLVPKEMSLAYAAHLLSQGHVSGAPVVDETGRCIGVISTTDFLHYAEQEHGSKKPDTSMVRPWQMLDPEAPRHELVGDYMNPNPVTATPAATIGVLARRMIDAHIHRIIVVDEQVRPIGVVSSTDILAAVANADAESP